MFVSFDHRADGIDRDVEPPTDLAIRVLQGARARRLGVEIGGKPRPIGTEGLELCRKRVLAPIALAPALERSLKRIQRQGKPLCGGVNRA
jgi:hypothetical protein